jgi:alanine racemase
MAFVPTARIDLDALRHNLAVARAAAPGRKTMAVIKADAYGHGLVQVANALEAADALAVARLGEAVALHDAGCRRPIVLLEGCLDAAELAEAVARDFVPVVHHPEQLALLRAARPVRPLACWLKVDTGMHRLGFAPEQVADAFAELSAMDSVRGRPGLMTHLANADDRWDPTTAEQLARFQPLAERFAVPTSIANSAGILGCPDSHGDWIRPGLMLYGASPFLNGKGGEDGLRPVMTLSARLIAVNQLKAGDPVGYGGSWRCPQDMAVGVVGIGYGDGYPREIAADTPVLVNGRQTRIVARVSMDMVTVDLSGLPEARVGDQVTLWGEGLPAERIALAADTIPYTLFCGITSRVHFDYVGGQAPARESQP